MTYHTSKPIVSSNAKKISVTRFTNIDAYHSRICSAGTLSPGIANLATDVTFYDQSEELISLYQNIILRLKDAQRIAGRKALINALKAHEQNKSAADGGVPGAQASYDKLKVRFERAGVTTQQSV